MTDTCETCAWFRPGQPRGNQKADGTCMNAPPAVVTEDVGNLMQAWSIRPAVNLDDYCGRYRMAAPRPGAPRSIPGPAHPAEAS